MKVRLMGIDRQNMAFTDGNDRHNFRLPSSLGLLLQEADILDTGKPPGEDRGSIREGEGERRWRVGSDSNHQEEDTGMAADSTEVGSTEEGSKEEGRVAEQLRQAIHRLEEGGIRGIRCTRVGGNDADTRLGAAADTGGMRRLLGVEVAGPQRLPEAGAAADAVPGRADHRFRRLCWCFEVRPFLRTGAHH